MKEHHITLRNVQERTGASYQSVQRWLGGNTTIPADFIARFIAAFPVSARWILSGEGEPEPIAPAAAQRFVSAVQELLQETTEADQAAESSPPPPSPSSR